ncbi:hypothetical protein CLPU_11c00150 [Gottschalkia purinilytica]|uniref:Potassium channel domain-containing protein n=1 Tax=Gottschalkia purinilytica TaxID=1503 RepID=A0A0L0W8S0_GOTPU|nr:ion channel [Gottschalkia purinilytica]KNF07847.1 hypothetical protein CLPU_11c00150 [Gottschalkia purinilytica]
MFLKKEQIETLEEYILKNIDLGYIWIQFEEEKYHIRSEEGIEYFVFDDCKIISFDEFWNSELGILKKKLLLCKKSKDSQEFLKKHRNFTGLILKNKKIDQIMVNILKEYNLNNIKFEDCNFENIILRNCELSNMKVINSSFFNVKIENVHFLDCYFYKRRDIKESTFNKLVFEKSIIKDINWKPEIFNNNTFIECKISNFKRFKIGKSDTDCMLRNIELHKCEVVCSSFDMHKFLYSKLTGNIFKDKTSFYCCEFENNIIKNNEFIDCNFESSSFFGDIENNNSNMRNIYTDNLFKHCILNSADFSRVILGRNNFTYNTYNHASVFSLKYFKYIKNIYKNEEKKLYKFKEEYCKILFDLYNNLYKEFKENNILKSAYDYYYVARKIEILKKYYDIKCKKFELKELRKFDKEDLSDEPVKEIGIYKNSKKTYLIKDISMKKIELRKMILSYLLCGFGEKPIRAFIWCLLVIFFSAFLFMFLGIEGKSEYIDYIGLVDRYFYSGYDHIRVSFIEWIKDFGVSFYFSVISFTTIGFGDIHPLSAGSRILVIIEAILSISLINLFIVTLVRKMLRD